MFLRDRLPVRDWSKRPDAWRFLLAFAVGWAVVGCACVAYGRLFGLAPLGMAGVFGFASRHAYLAARPTRRSRPPQAS